MKKTTTFTFAHLLLWLVCATLPLGFTACSDDEDPTTEQSAEPEPEPEPDADYTVMLYGCGGGNLDDALIYNLSQVEGYGYSDKVQFTGLVKFSVPYQTGDDAQFQGTRLYSLTPTGMENERIADADYRLDNPDHLASFISDAAERMPAKRYVLVLWNHGSEFTPVYDQPSNWPGSSTRGVVFDDNVKEAGLDSHLSIFELEEGLKRSGVHFDLIYMDVCLMNMMENICQIADYTDYILSASHITPGYGGHYGRLMDKLEQHSEVLPAMQEYVPLTVELWKSLDTNNSYDLSLTDTRMLQPVLDEMRLFTDALIEERNSCQNDAESLELFDYYQLYSIYQFDQYPGSYSIDLDYYANHIANYCMNGTLSTQAYLLSNALQKMQPVRASHHNEGIIPEFTVGITWMPAEYYNKNDFVIEDANGQQYEYADYAVLYPILKFHRQTGWGNFLSINEFQPKSENP